ncbi:MAG: hypothetical protein O3B18_06015 [Proteobacteria bacterium]|nr:hypothetical protein [Pseudomonadota bacterium]MDA0884475.1 hypothetical protein [Pseudomonadota bacterium]MDA1150522.1 hypothetical protein [Pseudomonadota bacterium]
MTGDLAPLRIACSIFVSSISLLVRQFGLKIKIFHIGNKDCRQVGQLQYRKIMSFWAKKQGFLVKSLKGGDQKTGMITFERVMLRYLTLIKECRDGLFDLTSVNDGCL